MNLPSAEEFCPYDHREIRWGKCGRCADLKDYAVKVLEAAAEQIVRIYEPSSYRDAAKEIAANILKMREDL